jgi:hypothetical protein
VLGHVQTMERALRSSALMRGRTLALISDVEAASGPSLRGRCSMRNDSSARESLAFG